MTPLIALRLCRFYRSFGLPAGSLSDAPFFRVA
jgi:hypothetical protein